MKTFKEYLNEAKGDGYEFSTLTTNVDGKVAKLKIELFKNVKLKSAKDIVSIQYKGDDLYNSAQNYTHLKTGKPTMLFNNEDSPYRLFLTLDMKNVYFE